MPTGEQQMRTASAHNLSVLDQLFEEFAIDTMEVEFDGRMDAHVIALTHLGHTADAGDLQLDVEDARGITVTGLQRVVGSYYQDATREACPPMRLDQALAMMGDAMLQADFGGWDAEAGSEGRITISRSGPGLSADIDIGQRSIQADSASWQATPAPVGEDLPEPGLQT